jgi:hypothetical protein
MSTAEILELQAQIAALQQTMAMSQEALMTMSVGFEGLTNFTTEINAEVMHGRKWLCC